MTAEDAKLHSTSRAWDTPSSGQIWLAGGLDFTSFEFVRAGQMTVTVERLAESLPQVSSWLAEGPNEPVSPDELTNAIGEEALAEFAEAQGRDKQDVARELSETLPGLIDSISSDGRVDEQLVTAVLEDKS
ncbi:YidB family protein [Streptomyces goshikiensis]|uniref:YidB family protein n=1 Tax=Streptomyces goshikiensis TaxID=1942 RepID=UPI0016765740|nr:YidB family protein [Streptomyces goshikiensis]GHD80136.1 hypothetical protein GCM10010336_63370 [Streptomyces goshikiensis]